MTDAPYHHGDLPRALLRAVDEIVTADGVGGVSLRGVARRAGVSHAAPAHHFGDRAGMLAAYAAEGFDALRTAMIGAHARLGDDATMSDALKAMGRAYVSWGQASRGHYNVMFRKELVDCEDEAMVAAGGCAFAVLLATIRACLDDASDEDVAVLAMTAWSTVHGFLSLHLELPTVEVDHLPELAPMLEPALTILAAGLASHPGWCGDERLASTVGPSFSDPLVPETMQVA